MAKTSSFDCVSTRQQRIAELAKQNPQMAFTSLNHYLDMEWLRAAFFRTRKNGAPGVDGQTWDQYAEDLETNLQSLSPARTEHRRFVGSMFPKVVRPPRPA
jgi:RNA-directed DNA polymerase